MLSYDPEVIATFEEETLERLADIEFALLKLERDAKNVDDEMLNGIFRNAHSIKASANLLKFKSIEDVAHRAENILQKVRDKELEPTVDLVSVLLESFDAIRELVDHLGSTHRPDTRECLAKLDQYL